VNHHFYDLVVLMKYGVTVIVNVADYDDFRQYLYTNDVKLSVRYSSPYYRFAITKGDVSQ